MSVTALDDIESWSTKLSPWRRDCLRRLAISNDLSDADIEELLAMVRKSAGLDVTTPPPIPVPFTKAHVGGKGPPTALKRIANVQNVNRLLPGAGLEFAPTGLTIVYGRNGSGKSGFVRILRTACRTRIENPAKLKVLADVYGSGAQPQSAEIVVNDGSGDTIVKWKPGMEGDPLLAPVAVFDAQSAQLYVDDGSQIRYLPFGLALPHRLNTISLTLKEKIEAERNAAVGDKLTLTTVTFSVQRATKAQKFNSGVTAQTTDAAIEAAAKLTDDDVKRLDKINGILAAGTAAAADMSALMTWVNAIKLECEAAIGALNDEALSALTDLKGKAVAARQAAELSAGELFTDEPLSGIGSETWRALWAAARDYSLAEAYPEQGFPVVAVDGGEAACVLCQQPLKPVGAARMKRFRKYMDDTLDVAATKAEQAVIAAETTLPSLEKLGATDFADRLDQVRHRDATLAESLAAFQKAAIERRADAVQRLAGSQSEAVAELVSPATAISALADKLGADKEALAQASKSEERQKLVEEKAEIEDLKTLAMNKAKLTSRRDLLLKESAYTKALAEIQTKGVTKKANDLLDAHLSSAVTNHFDAERTRFDIMHLNVALARKSGQTKAEFEIDPQTKIAKVTSDILSEGEQRALALAGFLTEVALTDGAGAIIVDDPVSSLDRDRSVRVADRLTEEANKRQVIVFTHDIVFFNELCRAADEKGIEPATVALFSDKQAAGKIDKAGMVWKGLNVAKRIGQLKNDSAPLPKLHATSPADYEVRIKNLYGRLRDTYERVIEEVIFHDVVRRGVDVIKSQELRYVSLSHGLAIRFHEGMARANTHSHDNPASDTVPVPSPDDFKNDLAAIQKLVDDLKAESATAEAARPQMKPKLK
jgi:energy-coupling factor transporter ATP-binding protein EcfA2